MDLELPIRLMHNGEQVGLLTMGAAEGSDVMSLWIHNGDILNVRNVQGGFLSDDPGDLNLDLGAGSTENPGNIILNFDVGKNTEIFNGKMKRIAAFRYGGAPDGSKDVVRHYAKTYLHRGAYVPARTGSTGEVLEWRKL